MRFSRAATATFLFLLLTAGAAQSQVEVAIEHNDKDTATSEFKFPTVPPPAKNDAATKALFTLVAGQRDKNSSDLDVLHDGKAPTSQDQADKNFFLAQWQKSGRLAIDLGEGIEIQQINTYSWHPNSRGPQVYKLYAAAGAAPRFDPQPKTGADLAKQGWRLLASVDTRPKSGSGGGQYGVSVSSASSRPIGKYRYLLFDIRPTEEQDPFGNTFFSEIDVIDAAGPKPESAARARAISRSPDSAPCQITIDYSETPELKDWVEKKLQPALDLWYPKIVKALPGEGYTAPSRFTITITQDYQGVAATRGTDVVCSAAWLRKNLDGEAIGAVIHELVHVVQQYRRVKGGNPNPGWLVEGIADYIRWFKYEPSPIGTRPRKPDKASYTDSYRTTAGFLSFVVAKHGWPVVAKLNAAMRQGKYSADLWSEYTGHSVDELWQQHVATLKK